MFNSQMKHNKEADCNSTSNSLLKGTVYDPTYVY